MFAEITGIIAVALTSSYAFYVLTAKPKPEPMTVKLERSYFDD